MPNITQEPAADRPRATRGLALVAVLSVLSLLGVMLTAIALGGLGEWTGRQFIGMFGVVECAAGLAAVVLPNIWHLPIAEVATRRTTKLRLAPSVIFLPHWAALGRVVAGIALIGVGAWSDGVGPATLLLVPFILLLAWTITGISIVVARFGVDRPDLDVVQFVVRQPKKETELPPVSIGASAVQFVISIITLPMVKLLPPSAFYVPEVGCSWTTLAVTFAASVITLIAVLLTWRGRIDWEAPADQQREAERYA